MFVFKVKSATNTTLLTTANSCTGTAPLKTQLCQTKEIGNKYIICAISMPLRVFKMTSKGKEWINNYVFVITIILFVLHICLATLTNTNNIKTFIDVLV